MSSQLNRTSKFKVAILLLLAVMLFWWLNPYFFAVLVGPHIFLRPVFYVTIFLMALGALLSSAVSSRFWAIFSIAFFTLNLLIGASFAGITSHPMTPFEVQMIYIVSHNKGDLLSALFEFGPFVAKVLVAVAFLTTLLIWARMLVPVRTNVPLFVCTLVVLLPYGVRLIARGDPNTAGFPSNFAPSLAASALTIYQRVHRVPHEEDLPLKSLPVDRGVHHIVLVIDESVEAEAFAMVFQGARIGDVRDLGVAYSYGNCSFTSNAMLRKGINPMDAEGSFGRLPSLFQLAKRTGFTTAYLDAQGDSLTARFFFDPNEKASIDDIPPIQKFGPRYYDRDLTAVRILTETVRKADRTFTILNKVGTHFPYSHNLPPDQAGVANPYLTSVKRSSVGFLAGLAGALPPGTLVFYTSDHGQNFHSKTTHCNIPPYSSASEWMVPLLVLYSDDMHRVVDRIDASWQGHASHAALAETLRNLLGYQSPWGGGLLMLPKDTRLHRGFYGPPRPMFGPSRFLMIDEDQGAFQSSVKKT